MDVLVSNATLQWVPGHLDLLPFVRRVKRMSAYVQPCAVTARVSSDTGVRVELVPKSAFDAIEVPRPQLAVEPSVTGRVYEVTATGDQPVAGAMVWLEEPLGITHAQTMTDEVESIPPKARIY